MRSNYNECAPWRAVEVAACSPARQGLGHVNLGSHFIHFSRLVAYWCSGEAGERPGMFGDG